MLVYGVALTLSLIKYKYYYETKLKALPILLGYVFLTEILGVLIRDFEEIQIIFEKGYQNYNHMVFNILDIVFFLYFYWMYRNSTTNPKLKLYTKLGCILFCLASILNPFFENFILYPQLGAILTGSVALTIFAYMYLKETKDKPLAFSNYHKLVRWISIGFLIFYPAYPFIIGIGQLDVDLYKTLYLGELLLVLIVALYSCIIIGFVWIGKMSDIETKKPSN